MKAYIIILLNLCFLFQIDTSASNLLFPNERDTYWGSFKNLKLPYDANTVNTIFQDSNGLMWIGTKRGLISYNGFNYHLCYFGKNMPDENTIQAIVQADDSHLYIGTDNGIRKLSLNTWKFENLEKGLTTIKAVRTLAMSDGKLWIGTRDEGLFCYNIKKCNLKKIPSKEFAHKFVYSLLVVGDKLFIGSYGGLNIYDNTKQKFSAINLAGENGTIINSLAYDKPNNCIWLGTDGKLLRYDLAQKKISYKKLFTGTYLKSIIVDSRDNRLMIGTETGLLAFHIDSEQYDIIEHNIHNSQSLCNNLIYNLYKDVQGNLWIATDNGISMLQHSPMIKDIKLSDLIDTNKGNLFTCILIGTGDEYWLGGENGLLHITKNSNIWYSTTNARYGLRNNNVRAIYRDRSNQIWIATDGGIAKLDKKTMQFVYCKIGNKQNNTNWTYGIYEDELHRIWIATYMSGLIVVDKKDIEKSSVSPISLSRQNFFEPKEIKSVYQMRADQEGNIWLNTNKGLLCINPTSGEWEQKNIYLDNFICDANSIWFSDQGYIFKYDIKSKKKDKVPYVISYGSANSIVSTHDRIWISSVDGIFYIDKRTLSVSPCGIIDKHYKCAVYDNAYQRIIFGGEDGLAALNINIFNKTSHHKKAIVSVLSCDNLLLPVTRNRMQEAISLPTNRNVTIELASYDYSTQSNTFYYKWNNDKRWQQIKADVNQLEYPIMPSGRNTLKLSLTNPDIDKTALVTTYVFTVPYPWYYTTWAWGAYLLCAMAGIFALFKMQKRKNERIYEKKAKEKTMELTRMKMEFFVDVSHELKTPLSLIIAPLSKLLSECSNSKMRNELKGIQRNALKLNSLIYKIIDDKQMEYKSEESVLRSHVELISLINNCLSSFSPIIVEKKISVDFLHREGELWLNIDCIKIESVFTNLLSNAIKHVGNPSGKVRVEVLLENDAVVVTVSDNGKGIPASEMPLIFIRHYQGKTEKKENHGTGIGLYLVKKYVELHKGTVQVSNDNGAIFTVNIPLVGNCIENISTDVTIDGTQEEYKEEEKLPVVLVIDDNVEVVEFLCSTFCGKYKCLSAFNGKEGLDVLQKHQVDLLIVDQMMPVMNGMDFVRTIKHNALTENVPVIMLTAKDDFDTEMQSIKAGVDVFIPKPFDFNKLLLQVARLIKRTQSIQRSNHIEKMIGTVGSDERNAESADEVFMKELLKSIEGNMNKERYNVSMVSEMMGIDQKQLYRKIKQLTGKTPVSFLRSMRLKKAAELLGQNRFTISEVMYMVGISNASYFTKCFSAEYGMTPKQYVQEHSS